MDMFDNQGYEFVFVFISFVRFVLPFYLPLGITDQGSHGGLFSPLPTTVRTFHFCREETSALSSLVDCSLINSVEPSIITVLAENLTAAARAKPRETTPGSRL